MPLKKSGKFKGSGGTHAHYAGEFGSSGKKIGKAGSAADPAHRAARASHYLAKSHNANVAHHEAHAKGDKVAMAQHALVAAHAEKKVAKHAKALETLDPGGKHHLHAVEAHHNAKLNSRDIATRSSNAQYASDKAKAHAESYKTSLAIKTGGHPVITPNHGLAKAQKAADEEHEKYAQAHKFSSEAEQKSKSASLASLGHDSDAKKMHYQAASAHKTAAEWHQAHGDLSKAAEHHDKMRAHMEKGKGGFTVPMVYHSSTGSGSKKQQARGAAANKKFKDKSYKGGGG